MADNIFNTLGYYWNQINESLEDLFFGDEENEVLTFNKSFVASDVEKNISNKEVKLEQPRMPDIYKFLSVVDAQRKEKFLFNLRVEAEKQQSAESAMVNFVNDELYGNDDLTSLLEKPNAILEFIKNIPSNLYAYTIEPIINFFKNIVEAINNYFNATQDFQEELVKGKIWTPKNA